MEQQAPLLWDLAERAESERDRQRDVMDRTRRSKIKRFRASSQWMMVMRVARRIPHPFTLNDLSVACFLEDAVNFGMKGHPQYPDNHRIHYILYGEKGLIAAGLLRRIAEGLFEAAPDADAILRRMQEPEVAE